MGAALGRWCPQVRGWLRQPVREQRLRGSSSVPAAAGAGGNTERKQPGEGSGTGGFSLAPQAWHGAAALLGAVPPPLGLLQVGVGVGGQAAAGLDSRCAGRRRRCWAPQACAGSQQGSGAPLSGQGKPAAFRGHLCQSLPSRWHRRAAAVARQLAGCPWHCLLWHGLLWHLQPLDGHSSVPVVCGSPSTGCTGDSVRGRAEEAHTTVPAPTRAHSPCGSRLQEPISAPIPFMLAHQCPLTGESPQVSQTAGGGDTLAPAKPRDRRCQAPAVPIPWAGLHCPHTLGRLQIPQNPTAAYLGEET